ncbi:hypothetical protein TSUD_239330 [Trifolium subterraneum]|uniref:NYN domain-containing protein n=1 Tax=Trifolium subterraneum TaxID=3900 RepID=A0A2Z6P0T7_TRISU|nr:hypothetical protein TSUD_239330 [Trifolium subterraneum]
MDIFEEAVPKSSDEEDEEDSDSDDDLYLDVKHKKCSSCVAGDDQKLSVWWDLENGDRYNHYDSLCISLGRIRANLRYYNEVMNDWFYGNIIIDMLAWAKDNPPPATLLLILDDFQTSDVVEYLHAKGYTLVVTQLAGGPPLSNGESQQQQQQQHGDSISSIFPPDSDKMDGVEAVPKENVDSGV